MASLAEQMNRKLIASLRKANISCVKQRNITEKLESQFKPFTIEIVIIIYISVVIDNILINIVYNYTELFTVQLVKKNCVEINFLINFHISRYMESC